MKLKSLNLCASVIPVLGMVLLGACGTATQEVAEGPLYTNDELRWMVEREITGDPSMPANEIEVSADASTNEVVLDGRVTSQEIRARVVELANRAEPNLVIVDRIDVVPMGVEHDSYTEEMAQSIRKRAKAAGEKIGASMDDAWVYTSVVAKLAMDNDTPVRSIDVDVEDGKVTLRGEVYSEYVKAEAERIVKSSDGVDSVDNQITVKRG